MPFFHKLEKNANKNVHLFKDGLKPGMLYFHMMLLILWIAVSTVTRCIYGYIKMSVKGTLKCKKPLKCQQEGKATHSSILAWRIPWTICSLWGCKESDMIERLARQSWLDLLKCLNSLIQESHSENVFSRENRK